jgi:hypothetical protein
MSFEEYEDCFVWQCDDCSLRAEFPPGDFWGALAELKARGWRIWREEDGWTHRCARCKKTGAEILATPFSRESRGR